MFSSSSTTSVATKTLMQQQQNYWAKGTGFGTGSTASNWSIEKAYKEKKKEEELLVIVFKVEIYLFYKTIQSSIM